MTQPIPPLKAAKQFQADDFLQSETSQTAVQPLEAARTFENHSFEATVEVQLKAQPQTPSSLRYWLAALLCLLLLGAWQWGHYIYQSWQNHAIQGIIVSTLSLLVFALLSRAIFGEWRQWSRTQQRQKQRALSAQLQLDAQYGGALPLCEAIYADLAQGSIEQVPWQHFSQYHQVAMSDAETLQLFDIRVLQPIDRHVKQQIRQAALQTSVAVAMSPFAMADMLVVVWRASKLLHEISSSYGCYISIFGRFKLIKQFVQVVFFTGASELLVDVSADLLGAELTTKLSARLGQGVLAGVMIGRLGRFALQELRPIAPTLDDQQGIQQLMQDILRQLKPNQTAN